MRRSLLIIMAVAAIWALELNGQVNKRYFVWLSQDLVMEDRNKEAIENLNVLLRADPEAHEGYFWRGIAKYNLDDLLGAEADFTAAIEKNPVYTFAYLYRAITRSRLGNYDDALRDFDEAIELRPDRPGPYYSRGVTYFLTQQFEKAIADFDMFIRFDDKLADAYLVRGRSYLHLRDTVQAHRDLDKAVVTNREYPLSYVERGSLYMAEKELDKALEDYNMAIKLDSTYILARFNRAIVYNQQNKPMLALADLDKVIELDPLNSITYFNRALIRSEIGDYNRALEDYGRVAEYSPNNVIVYYNRAGLYYNLGEFEKALEDYDKAIELYPDFANAYLHRSDVKYLLRDGKGSDEDRSIAERKIAEYRSKIADSTYSIYADTSRHFNQLLSFDTKLAGSAFRRIATEEGESITLRPLYKFTYYRTDAAQHPQLNRYPQERLERFVAEVGEGMLLLTNGDTNISPDSLLIINNDLNKQLVRNDSQWELLFKKGIAQSLIRQYTNAVNTYSTAIELDPTNPFLYLNRSATRAEMIDFISSIDTGYNNISIESDPSPRLRNNTVRTYSYDEAIADLNAAAKLYPELAHIYYNRANLLALSGEYPEAFDDFTRAIELNPDLADAWFNRGLVQIYMKDTRKGLLDISKAGELGIKEAYTVLKRYSEFED